MTDVILCAASNLFRMYVISRFMKVLLGEPRVSRGDAAVCLWDFLCGEYGAVSVASFILGEFAV